MDGIDMLLQAVSYYRKRAPQDDDEHECVENLFTSLCTALLVRQGMCVVSHTPHYGFYAQCVSVIRHRRPPARLHRGTGRPRGCDEGAG